MPIAMKKVERIRRQRAIFRIVKTLCYIGGVLVLTFLACGISYLILKGFGMVLQGLEAIIQFAWTSLIFGVGFVWPGVWLIGLIFRKKENSSKFVLVERNLKTIEDRQNSFRKQTREKYRLKRNQIELDQRINELEQELRSIPLPQVNQYKQEIADVLGNPDIENMFVDAEQNSLYVQTKPLFFTHPQTNEVYELGAFRIAISLNGQNKLIGISGLGRPQYVKEVVFVAPYVDQQGDFVPLPNLLKTYNAAVDYLSNFEISQTVSILVNAIRSVNVEDQFGKNIIYWPKMAKVE